MASNTLLLDGRYVNGVYVNRPRISYPFQANSDQSAIVVERDFRRLSQNFIPGLPGIEKDPTYADAYLMDESDPVPTGTGSVLSVNRTFARIPRDQVTYGSRVIAKPNPSTVGTGEGAVVDYTIAVGNASLGVAYSYGGATFFDTEVFRRKASSSTLTPAAGGTFTLTYKTDTTAAIAYNESNANIATALNALASVVSDGLTFTATNGLTGVVPGLQLLISVGSTNTAVTMNAASLTPAGASTAFSQVNTSTSQNCYIAARATIASHGFAAASDLLVYNGSHFLIDTSKWQEVDANTIAFSSLGSATTYTVFGDKLGDYTPGTDRVGVRRTQKFYLPGVTAGITTPSDIPLPALLLNDEELLTAVIAYQSGYQTYDASELVKWNGWPIYTQTFEEIDMATL